MELGDLLRHMNSGAAGANNSLARLLDSVAGNPVAKAANTFGADIDANPLLRLMNRAGLAQGQGAAFDAGRTITDFAGGMVPGAGDVDAIKQAQEGIEREGWNTETSLYAALAAAGLLPFVPQAGRWLMDKLPGGDAPRVGDRFGANERGQIGDLTKDRAKLLPPEERGQWHPIGGGKKLSVPVDKLSRTVGNASGLPHPTDITAEQLQGSRLIGAIADRSDIGKDLLAVGDSPLATPVRLEGGHGYMRSDNPWASAKGRVGTIAGRARDALDAGMDPQLTFVPGGYGATDFSTMMSDALLEQMKAGDISKTAKTLFDRKLRKIRPEWLGIDHPGARPQLDKTGDLRVAFAKVAKLDDFQKRGFPDIAETRYGIIDPELMHTPIMHGGQSIARLDGSVITDPSMPHSTYDTQMGGQYTGRLGEVPPDILFRDFYANRRAAGKPEGSDYRSFDLGFPTQDADQQWVDSIMTYLGHNR